jgi:tRNA G10  N-methylase Trm11
VLLPLNLSRQPAYAYTYACHEDELPLCRLELRTLFGLEPQRGCLESPIGIDPSRSPFIKQRIHIQYESRSLQELAEQVKALELDGATFKIQYVAGGGGVSVTYEEERLIERTIGAQVRGKAEMRTPDRRLGVICTSDGRWLLGICTDNEALWLRHKDKPRQYSTALTTRMARAVVNIAVPRPHGIKAIDPCCGIGTVMVEALSMGIDIVGCDINPLAVKGARDNLAHFGFPDVVALQDMRDRAGEYDAAIVDLPYNLCSVLSEKEQLELLACVRRLADRAVIITTQSIRRELAQSGFLVADHCEVRKGSLIRQVLLCE